jgi:HAD superfamily hydrolase (TIGR01509 family)
MALRAVIFDTENVLYDGTALWRWLAAVLRQLGRHVPYETISSRWYNTYWRRVCSDHCGYGEAFRALLAEQGLSQSQIGEVEAAARAYRHRIAAPQRTFPGVAQTVAELKTRGLRLGVLCNSDRTGEELGTALAGLGLAGVFDAVTTSRDVGVCMPDAACYEAGLAELDAAPEQAAYVGNAADDLDGAERLGLATVAFNHEPGARARFYAARFCELVRLVAEASPHRVDRPDRHVIAAP